VPMLAISTTLLYGVRFYPSTNWLFWLAALLRVGPLVPDIVLDNPGARLPHYFLGGGLLAFFSLAPAPPSGFVQLVPDVVLNCSLGHILRARLSGSEGSTATKNRPFIPGGASIKTKPSFLVPLKCTMASSGALRDPVPIETNGTSDSPAAPNFRERWIDELLRTSSVRSSQNIPSTHSGGYAPKVLGESRPFARCARLGSRLY
jgi:hypothetical protein